LSHFIKGEIIEGKVLSNSATGETLISIHGKILKAHSSLQLRSQEILTLKVEEISPHPVLKLLGVKASDTHVPSIPLLLSSLDKDLWDTLVKTVSRLKVPQEDITSFRLLMDNLLQGIYRDGQEKLLKTLIDLLGLTWEAKLYRNVSHKKGGQPLERLLKGDLKGILSKLLSHVTEDAADLKRLVKAIENLQLFNRMTLEQQRTLFLPIPLQFQDGLLSVGQLLIYLPQAGEEGSTESKERRGEKRDEVRVSLLLQLSNLGPIRADISLRGKEISGRFLLSSEEALSLVRDRLSTFTRSLIKKGFSILKLECRFEDPEVVKRPLFTHIFEAEDGSLSLVA
jgi:hypothetical protein